MKDNKKEDSKIHFAKVYDYASEETWRTDFAIGQKGSEKTQTSYIKWGNDLVFKR
jgi:hypothetical protein